MKKSQIRENYNYQTPPSNYPPTDLTPLTSYPESLPLDNRKLLRCSSCCCFYQILCCHIWYNADFRTIDIRNTLSCSDSQHSGPPGQQAWVTYLKQRTNTNISLVQMSYTPIHPHLHPHTHRQIWPFVWKVKPRWNNIQSVPQPIWVHVSHDIFHVR